MTAPVDDHVDGLGPPLARSLGFSIIFAPCDLLGCAGLRGRLARWTSEVSSIDPRRSKALRGLAAGALRALGPLCRSGGPWGRAGVHALAASWSLAALAAIAAAMVPFLALDSCAGAFAWLRQATFRWRRVSNMAWSASLFFDLSREAMLMAAAWATSWLAMRWISMGAREALSDHWSGALGPCPKPPAPSAWRWRFSNPFQCMLGFLAVPHVAGGSGFGREWWSAPAGEDGLGRLRAMGLVRLLEPGMALWASLPIGICGAVQRMAWPSSSPAELIVAKFAEARTAPSPEEADWLSWVGSLGEGSKVARECRGPRHGPDKSGGAKGRI